MVFVSCYLLLPEENTFFSTNKIKAGVNFESNWESKNCQNRQNFLCSLIGSVQSLGDNLAGLKDASHLQLTFIPRHAVKYS